MRASEFLARSLAGYGVTHVFFVPTILSDTLVQMEDETQITRVVIAKHQVPTTTISFNVFWGNRTCRRR